MYILYVVVFSIVEMTSTDLSLSFMWCMVGLCLKKLSIADL